MASVTPDASQVEALIERLREIDPIAAAEPERIRVVHAPGRVNLIGEHTDYNDGFVLPAAIDLGVTIALVPTDDRRVQLTLAADDDRDGFDLDAVGPRTGRWIDYIAGTAWALAGSGISTRGFRGLLVSDLPSGAGLSSSAAIELASAWALAGGDRPEVDPIRLAQIAQRAENEYVGVNSGLMDQFAVACGRADHALFLDCRSLEYRAVRLPPGVSLVICHSGAPRKLAASEYNARRADCDRAVAAFSMIDPGVRALRDVTPELLAAGRDLLDDVAFRRARHVVSEDGRVLDTLAAMQIGDLPAVGDTLRASHVSLRDDFEVSSPALDALVAIAALVPGVIGARLTGAGFGGCTINLVHDDAVALLVEAVADQYASRTGLTPRTYVVHAAEGARRID
ncbi:MAG: galactokinase [Thermomicrobiales bacterium]|nr:MAG: galactokinase [Thermomicrobiales bacterium]